MCQISIVTYNTVPNPKILTTEKEKYQLFLGTILWLSYGTLPVKIIKSYVTAYRGRNFTKMPLKLPLQPLKCE